MAQERSINNYIVRYRDRLGEHKAMVTAYSAREAVEAVKGEPVPGMPQPTILDVWAFVPSAQWS